MPRRIAARYSYAHPGAQARSRIASPGDHTAVPRSVHAGILTAVHPDVRAGHESAKGAREYRDDRRYVGDSAPAAGGHVPLSRPASLQLLCGQRLVPATTPRVCLDPGLLVAVLVQRLGREDEPG